MHKPRFLFIFTPPFSGSTALAMILNSSPRAMVLEEKGEGQWLVPSLSGSDRWNAGKVVDWGLVKKVWLERYHAVNKLVSTIDVVIEKSPPNLLRITHILECFEDSSCFAFNRNPYANCASIFYRKFSSDDLSLAERRKVIKRIAIGWLARAEYLSKAIKEMDMLYFSYEDFCSRPAECVNKVMNICPELDLVDCSHAIQVKDYPMQHIKNHNSRQIRLLSEDDISCITGVLNQDKSLLEYFGYMQL